MRQAILFLTCCFAGSLFITAPVAAQSENMAIVAPIKTQSVLSKTSPEAEQHAMLLKDPVICMDCEASSDVLAPLVHFPSNFRALFPAPDGCSYLLFGLLGLLGLGLGLFALNKFSRTEKGK